MTNYLTNHQFAQAKSRLTKAVKSGNPRRILEVVQETFDEWDDGDYAYPDDWHRWERARMDAETALLRAAS